MKCQVNKYKAGGRCGGTTPGGNGSGSGNGNGSSTSSGIAAMASLQAARDAQDKMWEIKASPLTLTTRQSQSPGQSQLKKTEIDFILEGDY